MDKLYKSKVDTSIVVILLVGIWGPIASILYIDFSLVAFCIVAIMMFSVLTLLYSIRYIINDKWLFVKYCHFYTQKFCIEDIKSIKKTRTILSAPAASFDRLELNFGNAIVVISPKDKIDFINTIKEISHNKITVSI